MRIPHHLVCSSSGRWSFRQRVPADLHTLIGQRVHKRTFATHDVRAARLRALMLAAGHAQAFARLRVSAMTKKDVDVLLAALRGKTLHDYTIERDAGGTFRVQVEPGKDAEAAMDALELIGRLNPAFFTPAAPEAPEPGRPSLSEVLRMD